MEQTICCGVKLGQTVPNFTIETYDPNRFSFGNLSLDEIKRDGKWTVLFFYPADFTFV
jgi:peroxiredoxin (alkyl hydroperoxide reductase subunit C)